MLSEVEQLEAKARCRGEAGRAERAERAAEQMAADQAAHAFDIADGVTRTVPLVGAAIVLTIGAASRRRRGPGKAERRRLGRRGGGDVPSQLRARRVERAVDDHMSGRRVDAAVNAAADFRAALARRERRWRELCRAERDRVVSVAAVPSWVRAAEAAECERRRERERVSREEAEAQRAVRLAGVRARYSALPGVGSLRGRWLAALATTGDGSALGGLGTLRPTRG